MAPYELLNKLHRIQYGWWNSNTDKIITWKDKKFDDPDYFYKNCQILKPAEVWKRGYGTCWDVSLLIYDTLKQSGIKDTFIYWFESIMANGNTASMHTATWYRDPSSKMYFWFEFSWFQHRGIHGPFSNENRLFEVLENNYITPANEKLKVLNRSFDAQSILDLSVISAIEFARIAQLLKA